MHSSLPVLARQILVLSFSAALALSLVYSLSIRQGHADSPIADSAETIQPLKAGDSAPEFIVRDVNGDDFRFDPDALERPAILITFRGGWCPYCNLHLSELRHVLPAIEDRDIDVYFLSGDRPDQLIRSLQPETREDVESLDYTLLSDAEATAAIALGVAFRAGAVKEKLVDYGLDVDGSSLDRHDVLPVPAVYAITADGVIDFAYTNADYRVRLPVEELLQVANGL